MIIFEKIFVIVLCHLIGDYVLQSDYIATTKGSNWYHLVVHSLLYSVPFYLVFGWRLMLLFLIVNHITMDALKARYNVIDYKSDQINHYAVALLYLL